MQATIQAARRISLPQQLQYIPEAPRELWATGPLPPAPYVAIVGSRQASSYGERVASRLASGLAARSVTVVSGLAFGIDTTVHQAVLAAGGRSIAILPAGLHSSRITPRSNLALAAAISEHGVLLSEYEPNTAVRKEYYLARNRLIAGLAEAVVVIEAALPSGSLTTAQHAIEQGRTVWAVPGCIDSPQAAGTNHLIRDGAQPLVSLSEFFDQFGPVAAAGDGSTDPILAAITNRPTHIEELIAGGVAGYQQVTALELQGAIRHVGGGYYVRE